MGLLYDEWITIAHNKKESTRTAYSIWDVIGYVGGIQQVVLFASIFVLNSYSRLRFIIDAINQMYVLNCKTNQSEFIKNGKLNTTLS